MRPEPRTDCELLCGYRRPVLATPVDLRLDGNEGARPTVALFDVLRSRGVEAVREYPKASDLEADLAKRFDRTPDQVLVTAGADEALDRLCRAYLEPGRNAVVPVPCFEMIARYVALARGEMRGVEWSREGSPVEGILAAADASTRLVIIASPNNPTGAVLTAEEFRRLAVELPQAMIVADLAYVEYAATDPTGALRGVSNLVCVRTLSKAWGLAGLRIGLVLGDSEIIEILRMAGGPYSVAGTSLALARARLGEESEMLAHTGRVREERSLLSDLAARRGLEVWPSEANFVYLRGAKVRWLYESLCGFGIVARLFESEDGCSLRITCPGEASAFARLERAIESALEPAAILFDVDGVLVDVSRSYRQAIVDTAAAFGVSVGPDEISARKAQGGANDDWELTRSLVAAAGVEVAIGDVIAEFERRYQGHGAEPGLFAAESMLIDRSRLENIAARVPIGIVTGRPRVDAERFLDQFGLRDVFSTCVCRDDTAAMKPDPEPVRVALERLGVERAWYIGDTPDDVRAARAAGCLPIGVVAPGEDVVGCADALRRAGAGSVLDSVVRIEEVLSW